MTDPQIEYDFPGECRCGIAASGEIVVCRRCRVVALVQIIGVGISGCGWHQNNARRALDDLAYLALEDGE